ncbi:protein SCAR1 isoform X2 [Malania oleifera]|nr:protein SCAR1 isoform X2 [Malania oleifera]
MDNYEECRDPPRLHLLDKFDTGGPGSCLKRYSDPTYFKRVSASYDEANIDKVRRDKKARKSKKKKSWQRNGEVLRGASVPNLSGRMHFASPNFVGQTSPRTASAFELTSKSEQGDKSNSFDSRMESGYIECVFRLSSSIQPEEEEPMELSSSRLKMQQNDNHVPAFPNEQNGVVDDDLSQTSWQEQTVASSSCVTWDEKTEIVEPKGQQHDSGKSPEMLSKNSDLDTQERGSLYLKNVNQVEILYDCKNIPKSSSGGDHLDEIESETDNFMDALNTIESESENDLDCQMKQEQCSPSFNNEVTDEGMDVLTVHYADRHPPKFESQTACCSSSTQGSSWDLANSVSMEPGQLPEIVGKSSNPDGTSVIDICESVGNPDDSKLESVVSDPSSLSLKIPSSEAPTGDKIIISFLESQEFAEDLESGNPGGSKLVSVIDDPSYSSSSVLDSQVPGGDKIISSSCESRESAENFPPVQSMRFWTNGGLLGLQPSKPPDCSILNATTQESLAKVEENAVDAKNHSVMVKGDGISECPTLCHNDQECGDSIEMKSLGTSLANLDAEVLRCSDCHHSNIISQAHGRGMNEPSETSAKTELPVASDAKTASTEARTENEENLYRVFGLSHRILGNSFRRTASLVPDDRSEVAGGHSNVEYKTSSEMTFKDQLGCGSLVNSPSSSPPLEHMKISFNPISGFENSRLKLKFPDSNECQESIRDMFPSFQLVPDPAMPLRDIGSDSDDDTFCRSSPYMSDDCHSLHSESNSEQWESGEVPGSKDRGLHNSLCRISSMESIPCSLEPEEMARGGIQVDSGLQGSYDVNGVEQSHPSSLLDFPSFDAVDPLLQQEFKNNSNPEVLLGLQHQKESAPLPPPLPPVQWRGLKSLSDVTEDRRCAASEIFNNTFDLKLLESDISQQPKPAPAKLQQLSVEALAVSPKTNVILLQGEQKEANQVGNGAGIVEREDFLQQIRTKSFSLRHTATVRPTFTPGPATNVKVTAILEKANAIRQAVGSDDGEDDNWSDT